MTTYIVIDIDTQAKLIDFSQIDTTSAQTMRRNLANTEAILSYQVTPSFITNGTVVPIATLNHAEAIALLSTAAWFPKAAKHVGTPLATLMVGKTVGEIQEGGDRKLREEVDEEHTGNIGGSLIGRPLGWQNPF